MDKYVETLDALMKAKKEKKKKEPTIKEKEGVPSRTLAFKQIGNAVPVCLAYHVATALLDRFDEQN